MPNEQDGKLKFGRSYVYLDPDSQESTPDAATPGVWRVKSGVDNSGDPSIGVVNAVNTRTGNVTLTSADVGLANVNNTSDANKPVSTAQQTALNAKIDTTTANSTLLGITAKAADSELLDGLNSTSFVQTNTQFGGDVSGTYNAIVIADDSHNHIISNVDGLQSALDIKADLVGGLVPTNQLPAIAITEYLGSVSSQSALLALSGQKGDWAIRSDTSTTWIITGTTPSDIGSWTELQYPAAPVSSVNGATGTVVLGHSDVGAASTAQGTTADSAIQPGDNISQLTNNSGFISATLTNEEVQDIVGGMVSGNTESGITVTYQDTDGTIDFDVATQSDNNFTTVLKNKLDAIEVSATADQTASEIITSLLTVDGANSGLDSDLLDGQHGAHYLDYTNFTNTPTFDNADKLDNLDSTQFIRSDAADIKTSGNLKFNDDIKLTFGNNDDLQISHNQTHNIIQSLNGNISLRAPAGSQILLQQSGSIENGVKFIAGSSVALYYDGSKKIETTNTGAEITGTLTATAFSGAGGSITGVNASLLNSQNAAYYLDYSNLSNTPTIPTNNNQLTNGAGYVTTIDGGNADSVDGLHAASFLRSDAADTITGRLTFANTGTASTFNYFIQASNDGGNKVVHFVNGSTRSSDGGPNVYTIRNDGGSLRLGKSSYSTLLAGSGDLTYNANTIWHAGNDGASSGLDADTVDGYHASITSTANNAAIRDSSSDINIRTVKPTLADETTISGAVGYRINNSTDNLLRFCSDMSAVRTHMGTNNASNLTTGTIPIARISGGAGTGLDADLLDGAQGSSYLRSDAADGFSGVLTGTAPIAFNGTLATFDPPGGGDGFDTATDVAIGLGTGHRIVGWVSGYIRSLFEWNSSNDITIGQGSTTLIGGINLMPGSNGVAKVNGNTIWHAGNDGAASSLDSDLLDGQHGAYYLDYNNLTNLPAGAGSTDIGAGNSKAEIIDTGTDGRFIVTTEGSERLLIDNVGNVGIGTTNPLQLFHLSGTNPQMRFTDTTTGVHFDINANSSAGNVALNVDNAATSSQSSFIINTRNSERFRIVGTTGNVGIGTSSPAATLDVKDTTAQLILNSTNDTYSRILHRYSGTGIWSVGTRADNDYYIRRDSGGGNVLIPSGNVGIGTSSPDHLLHIGSADNSLGGTAGDQLDNFRIMSDTSNTDSLNFTTERITTGTDWVTAAQRIQRKVDATFMGYIQFGHFGTGTNTGLITFGENNTEYARIDGAGNVGIGTSSPDTQLEVVSNGATGISSKSSSTQGTDTNKALKVRNNSTTDTFSVSYKGQGYFAGSVSIGGNTAWHAGNDGSGSGLDADTLDGIQASSFLRSDAADTVSGNISFTSTTTPITTNSILFNNTEMSSTYYTDATGVLAFDENFHADTDYGTGTYDPDTVFTGGNGGGLLIKNQDGWGAIFTTQNTRWASAEWANLKVGSNQVWHAGNDGSGSGLDADTLDGIQASSFLRSDAADTATSRIIFKHGNNTSANVTTGSLGAIEVRQDTAQKDAFMSFHIAGDHAGYFGLDGVTNDLFWGGWSNGANKYKIWHAANDGSGSGLDADTLDGIQASSFLRSDANDSATGTYSFAPGAFSANVTYGGRSIQTALEINSTSMRGGVLVRNANDYRSETASASFMHYDAYTTTATSYAFRASRGATLSDTFWVKSDGTGYFSGNVSIDGNTVWNAGNDGSGSGLDADTVDGIQASSFLRSDANDSFSGQLTGGGSIRLGGTTIECGNGSGSVAMTTNDGKGNANLCFNHRAGVPDFSGSSGRIECTVDGTTANMYFELANNTTAGTNIQTGEVMKLTTSTVTMFGNTAWHAGNDGSGSGLDADTLDGIQSVDIAKFNDYAAYNTVLQDSGFISYYALSTGNRPTTGSNYWSGIQSTLYNDKKYGWQLVGDSQGNSTEDLYVRWINNNTYGSWSRIWTAASDGSGSGLDADTVDGIQGASFLRSDADDTTSSKITFGPNPGWGAYLTIGGNANNSTASTGSIGVTNGNLHIDAANGNYATLLNFYDGTGGVKFGNGATAVAAVMGTDGDLWKGASDNSGSKYWHAGNDGAGSGLDADTLDGYTWASSGKQIRASDFYADNWFRNYNSGEGLYNEATGCHFVSDASEQWTIRDSGNSIKINFQTNGSTQRASVYADNTPSIGFLNSNNEWGLRYLSNNGNSPNLYFREQGNETWTGNPDGNMGKIEYHSNRFYIAAGSNSTYICQFRRSGSDVCRIENSGAIVSSSNITAYSDITLKTDIEVIPNALEKVQQLRGITYNRIDLDDGIRYAGVSAQEVEEVLPEVVQTGEDGIKSVAYGNIVSLLIEAMKEQQVQIDELKTLVNK